MSMAQAEANIGSEGLGFFDSFKDYPKYDPEVYNSTPKKKMSDHRDKISRMLEEIAKKLVALREIMENSNLSPSEREGFVKNVIAGIKDGINKDQALFTDGHRKTLIENMYSVVSKLKIVNAFAYGVLETIKRNAALGVGNTFGAGLNTALGVRNFAKRFTLGAIGAVRYGVSGVMQQGKNIYQFYNDKSLSFYIGAQQAARNTLSTKKGKLAVFASVCCGAAAILGFSHPHIADVIKHIDLASLNPSHPGNGVDLAGQNHAGAGTGGIGRYVSEISSSYLTKVAHAIGFSDNSLGIVHKSVASSDMMSAALDHAALTTPTGGESVFMGHGHPPSIANVHDVRVASGLHSANSGNAFADTGKSAYGEPLGHAAFTTHSGGKDAVMSSDMMSKPLGNAALPTPSGGENSSAAEFHHVNHNLAQHGGNVAGRHPNLTGKTNYIGDFEKNNTIVTINYGYFKGSVADKLQQHMNKIYGTELSDAIQNAGQSAANNPVPVPQVSVPQMAPIRRMSM